MSDMMQSSGQLAEFGSHLIKKAQWQAPPEAVSWWPNTPAWNVIFILLSLSLCIWVLSHGYRWLQHQYVREAKSLFAELEANNDLAGMARLMRQFCHQHWPSENLATLSVAAFSTRVVELSKSSQGTAKAIAALLVCSYQANACLTDEHRLAIQCWFKEHVC
ncbi:DUF4381 domain-containing protein [Shewanella schlegeliana]|uniref:DUF4381 domain-containing protein n=1 Tax=Shewanella schlegeliana TaxID=190308 RepID=A0ABS1T2Z9_9GAMM|nr:DUF4381 domain-containing protein [Shewanella schlegeliana]MBL4915180.1 DUF4381 domain-containing protein [Shewanella schlegeliana]MCL1110952.1 DUF4381 domain-containing protein [Shewanella schlegeliana]GIU29468.1 hypothetical protein TUM4433_18820 [Shewanella schlegeliana]